MKLATFALMGALLAAGALAQLPPPYKEPANGLPKDKAPTKTMNNPLLWRGTLQTLLNAPGQLLNGQTVIRRPGKATEKVEVDPGCLSTEVPAPLNWGPLWCGGPGKEAKVMQWTDEVGSVHRTVDIPVQRNVTANMVLWMFTPAFPQYLEFAGKKWYWYHLWHPMDHIAAGTISYPSGANPLKPGIYTLIHEHYRNTPAEVAKGLNQWETDTWFQVEDLFSNLLKKRIVISINTLGLQAWTLIVNLKDTPQGLKIDVEQIVGAAARGWDKTDPSAGVAPEMAQMANDNAVKPSMSAYAVFGTPEFEHSANAITRHVVEEFSMFRFFLPQIWARYPFMEQMTRASDSILMRLPKMNYGLGMFQKPVNMAGMTDLLATMNNTSVMNKTAMAAAISAAPQALATVANEQAQATVTYFNKNGELVTRALGNVGTNKTLAVHQALQIAIPSAANAFD